MQIGTLSGNPVAAVAGLATLEVLRRPGTYERVFAAGRRLMNSLERMLKDAGLPGQVLGEPPLFDVVFTDVPVRDYRGMLTADAQMARRFNQLLRAHGIMKGESKYYISTAHDEADFKHLEDAWASAIETLAAERDHP
jgi:glutamate-1-semialdehyde 2,1-aminomutase